MSDRELREHERAVAEGGGAAARIAWARALERAGRHADALSALLAGRDEPAIRAELARVPAWTERAPGDEEDGMLCARWRREHRRRHSRWLDAPGLIEPPEVLWKVGLGDAVDQSGEGGEEGLATWGRGSPLLLASPLGLVHADADGSLPLECRDPESGALRWISPAQDLFDLRIAGELLISTYEQQVTAHDLWTGERSWSWSPPDRDDLLLLRSRLRLAAGRVVLDHPARRRPLSLDLATGEPVRRSGSVGGVWIARTTRGIVARNVVTNDVLWRGRGDAPFFEDPSGVVASGRRGGLIGYDANGLRLWELDGPVWPAALGSSLLIAFRGTGAGAALIAIDRGDGAVTQVLPPLPDVRRSVLAFTQDAIYVAEDPGIPGGTAVLGISLRGELLWRHTCTWPHAVAATPGRLFLALEGSLRCLGR